MDTGRTTAPSPREPSPEAAPSLEQALDALHGACEGARLYGPDHPAVTAAVGRAAGAWRLAARAGRARVAIAEDHFRDGDRRLEGGPGLAALAALLHERDLATLEVARTVTADHLARLAAVLVDAPSSELRGEALAGRIGDECPSIVARPLRYGALRVAEGARAAEAALAPSASWADLVSAMDAVTEGAGDGPAPELLAARVNECASREEDLDLDALRDQIRRLAATAPPDDGDGATRDRIEAFVDALSPRLRRALLRIDPGRGAAPALDLVGVFAAHDVLDALEASSAAEASPAEEVLLMFSKLRRILDEGDGALRMDELLQLAQGSEDEEGLAIQDTIAELFTTREDAEHSPTDYRAHLQGLVEPLVRPRGEAPLDAVLTAEAIELHAAAVAAQLAVDEGTPGPGVYRHVLQSLDALLEADRHDVVRDVCAAAAALGADAPPATAEAATALLAEVHAPARVDAMLESIARRGADAPPAASDLLRQGGLDVLRAILDDPERARPRAVVDLVRRVAADAPPEAVERLVVDLVAGGARPAAELRALLDALPPGRRTALLRPLLDDAHGGVRFAALELAAAVDGWTAPLVERALGDAAVLVQAAALDQLAERPAPETTDVLARYVRGDLGAGAPGTRQLDRAVWLLATRPDGPPALATALRALGRTIQPRRALLGRRLARAVRSYADDDETLRRAFGAWRRSPGRLAARIALLGGTRRDDD